MTLLIYSGLALLFATIIGAFGLAPTCSLGYRPMVSGYTITLVTMLIYIAFSAAIPIVFNDMQFVNALAYSSEEEIFGTLCVSWAAVVLFVLSYLYFTRDRPINMRPASLYRPSQANFHILAYVMLAIGLVMKALFVQRSGGLQTLLLSRSGGLAQSLGLTDEVDRGSIYLNEMSFIADAAACWLLLTALRVRKSTFVHILIFAVTIGFSFLLTPKRLVLLAPILAILIGFGIYVWPLRLRYAPYFVAAAMGFSLITLLTRIFLPAYLAGVNVLDFANFDRVRYFVVHLMGMDMGFFEGTAVAVYGTNDVIAKFGSWGGAFYFPNVEPFFYIVPRFIWPLKPDHFVDVAVAVGTVMYGGTLEKANWGYGVGLVGTSWLYGGFAGLVVGMGILGWASAVCDRFMAKMHYASPERILIFAVACTTLFHLYRQGTIGWVFLNFVQTQAPFFVAVLVLLYVSSRGDKRSAIASPSVLEVGG